MIEVSPSELVTRKAFVSVFWRTLAATRRENPAVSRREVFEFLNGIYYDAYDEFLYPSYNAFRHSKEFIKRV